MTSGGAPSIFTDDNKFDGTNWVAWNRHINIVVQLKGATGYLDGSMLQPTKLTSTITVPNITTETNWESLTPIENEWKTRNIWTMALLIYNTKNPIGLGIYMEESAAEAWKSYKDIYEVASNMVHQNVEQDLHTIIYSDNNDFPMFIANMRNKWARANALGVVISDKNFKTIIINSLLRSWDPIVTSLFKDMPTSEAISQLDTWWLCISQDWPPRQISALQIFRPANREQIQLICSNPNCKRCRYTIKQCYWKGKGKKEQFSSGFGKRGGARGSAINSKQGTVRPIFTANIMITNQTRDEEAYVLMTIGDNDFQVLTTTTPIIEEFPDNNPTHSYNNASGEGKSGMGSVASRDNHVNTSVMGTKSQTKSPMLTLLDSSASDHYLTDRALFSVYSPLNNPTTGFGAGLDSTFHIIEKRNVRFESIVDGKP